MNVAKWLMYENQQPSVTQELGRLFSSIRCRGGRTESSELLRVSVCESFASATDTNNTSFATRSTAKQTIGEISGSRATSKKLSNILNQRNHCSLCHIKQPQEKLPVNLLFLPV